MSVSGRNWWIVPSSRSTRSGGRGPGRRRGPRAGPAAEVLEGRALLSFLPAAVSAAGVDPVAVAVGDFNGDGRGDVAVANNSVRAGAVSVRPSNPDGSLGPVSSVTAVPVPPTQLLAADLNGDGKADLITAGQGTSGSVILNNGDGTLQGTAAQVGNNFGHDLISVTAADFTGDGKPELVFGGVGFINNQNTASNQGFFEIEKNNGDGTITTFPWLGLGITGHVPVALATADVNRDGTPDVAVVNQDQNTLGVYLVTPLGANPINSFNVALKGNYGTPNTPTSVAVGDLNGDGLPDFVVGGGDGRLGVILGKADGSIQSDRILNTGFAAGVTSVAVADFNGDGKPDIAALYSSGPGGDGFVAVFPGNGDGTFQSPPVFDAGGEGSSSLAVGDFNGDGRPDLVVANPASNTVAVLLNDGRWGTSGSGAAAFVRLPGHAASPAPVAANLAMPPITTGQVPPATRPASRSSTAAAASAARNVPLAPPFVPTDETMPGLPSARRRGSGLGSIRGVGLSS